MITVAVVNRSFGGFVDLSSKIDLTASLHLLSLSSEEFPWARALLSEELDAIYRDIEFEFTLPQLVMLTEHISAASAPPEVVADSRFISNSYMACIGFLQYKQKSNTSITATKVPGTYNMLPASSTSTKVRSMNFYHTHCTLYLYRHQITSGPQNNISQFNRHCTPGGISRPHSTSA
jgi:hypothetical protein